MKTSIQWSSDGDWGIKAGESRTMIVAALADTQSVDFNDDKDQRMRASDVLNYFSPDLLPQFLKYIQH